MLAVAMLCQTWQVELEVLVLSAAMTLLSAGEMAPIVVLVAVPDLGQTLEDKCSVTMTKVQKCKLSATVIIVVGEQD